MKNFLTSQINFIVRNSLSPYLVEIYYEIQDHFHLESKQQDSILLTPRIRSNDSPSPHFSSLERTKYPVKFLVLKRQ